MSASSKGVRTSYFSAVFAQLALIVVTAASSKALASWFAFAVAPNLGVFDAGAVIVYSLVPTLVTVGASFGSRKHRWAGRSPRAFALRGLLALGLALCMWMIPNPGGASIVAAILVFAFLVPTALMARGSQLNLLALIARQDDATARRLNQRYQTWRSAAFLGGFGLATFVLIGREPWIASFSAGCALLSTAAILRVLAARRAGSRSATHRATPERPPQRHKAMRYRTLLRRSPQLVVLSVSLTALLAVIGPAVILIARDDLHLQSWALPALSASFMVGTLAGPRLGDAMLDRLGVDFVQWSTVSIAICSSCALLLLPSATVLFSTQALLGVAVGAFTITEIPQLRTDHGMAPEYATFAILASLNGLSTLVAAGLATAGTTALPHQISAPGMIAAATAALAGSSATLLFARWRQRRHRSTERDGTRSPVLR